MGDPTGFLKLGRGRSKERPVEERVGDYREFVLPLAEGEVRQEAARCMDCGVPFCHGSCPLGNLIPEWNDMMFRGQVDRAMSRLAETNNFPEVTGRICPAPCEGSCVLALDSDAVRIKAIEKTIADETFERSLIPRPAAQRTGKRVAVIGSGPAGMAAAQQLARSGHDVTLYERDDRIGGLLRYGIPDFKLEKDGLDRRVAQMEAEGVRMVTSADIGGAISIHDVRGEHDAVVLACGAQVPRDLPVGGRELRGIHFAMDFLTLQNRRVAGDVVGDGLVATGKHVVVIGGGDTGSDCVGTSHRQHAASVLQLEIMPRPPEARPRENPWPAWPLVLRTSSSHQEGGNRDWSVLTRRFIGDAEGNVVSLEAIRAEIMPDRSVREMPGTEFTVPCELALLAMGFTGPVRTVPSALGLILDGRGNVATDADGRTNVDGVFACGDMSRGQSLVVWAIADGRRVARGVDRYLAAVAAQPQRVAG
ncbi:glutamate synthase subunit beta [Pendulispora rubella]|uniref:Glutamate synthase subunit beta n=1 Tax=Pendulispora rubella TaxID=2741070 RepID=A0ABZ2L3Z2_9BACT